MARDILTTFARRLILSVFLLVFLGSFGILLLEKEPEPRTTGATYYVAP